MTNAATTTEEFLAVTARGERDGAIAAECSALTGATPDADGIARPASVSKISRAAYVHRGIRVLATAPTFDALLNLVGDWVRGGIEADRFRIEVHDPSSRSSQSTLDTVVALANMLPALPDLKAPLHRFVVVVEAERWTFGEVVVVADGSYRRHDDKPWTTSSSLDSRFARALVNLVPDARSVLDPCCGAGSIVLEAASLGLTAYGVDWKPAMVGMTTKNLAHFGYDAEVVRADSRTHEQPADAVVTDIPYGNAINSDEREIRAILDQAAAQAPRAVVVASADISPWLTTAGYRDIEVSTVMKRRGFSRWIHVARVGEPTAPESPSP